VFLFFSAAVVSLNSRCIFFVSMGVMLRLYNSERGSVGYQVKALGHHQIARRESFRDLGLVLYRDPWLYIGFSGPGYPVLFHALEQEGSVKVLPEYEGGYHHGLLVPVILDPDRGEHVGLQFLAGFFISTSREKSGSADQ
jgi:hypothetical protein